MEDFRGRRELGVWRGVRSGADGRFEDDVDVAVYERLLGRNDGRALQAEVVVEAVEDEVHAVRGDAVNELDDLAGGLATLVQANYGGEGRVVSRTGIIRSEDGGRVYQDTRPVAQRRWCPARSVF